MFKNNRKMTNKNVPKVYTFNQFGHPLRVGEINGEPWFVAKDVCAALNIRWSGNSVTLGQIPEGWKGILNFKTPGGNQDLTVISEAALYKLAFRCQSSEVADNFTNKVASEILPSIRKTGMYAVPQRRNAVALLPKDRGQKWGQFYAELARYTTREDEELVAGLMNVSRRHVHEVAMGRKPAYGVCCMLVDCAKANRAKGIERMTANRSVDMEELRLELMSGINPQEA